MNILHNGTLKSDEPVFTLSNRIRLGDGVFDTALVMDGEIQHAMLHFQRLIHDAGVLKISVPYDGEELQKQAQTLIEANGYQTGKYALNTIISRGEAKRGLMPQENAEADILMRLSPAPENFPDIHAIIAQSVRRNEHSPLSLIKSCNYGENILALLEAKDQDANEAILLNTQGNVTCASAGNIFIEKENIYFTPPLSDGVLNGVERQIFMQNQNVTESSLTPKDLYDADAIYITNSIRGVQKIKSLK